MKIVVIGLGRLGLPMTAVLAEAGHEVWGIDTDADRIKKLRDGECYIPEPDLDWKLKNYLIEYSTDYQDAAGADIVFVVVNTPPSPEGPLDKSQIVSALNSLDNISTGPVVITSTTQPGDMEELDGMFPDIQLIYQPQFIALGRVIADLKGPDMALYGIGDMFGVNKVEEVWNAIYQRGPVYRVVTNFMNAELIKLSINAFLCTKIAFANSLAQYCEKTDGADANVIIQALGYDHRINTAYMKPGMGYGGTCFPKDTEAFNYALRLKLNGFLTDRIPALNDYHNMRFRDVPGVMTAKKVAILGYVYKPNVPVTERSPAETLMKTIRLFNPKVEIAVYDPAIPLYNSSLDKVLKGADMVFICAPYSEFRDIKFKCKVVDCVGLFREGDQFWMNELWTPGRKGWQNLSRPSKSAS